MKNKTCDEAILRTANIFTYVISVTGNDIETMKWTKWCHYKFENRWQLHYAFAQLSIYGICWNVRLNTNSSSTVI